MKEDGRVFFGRVVRVKTVGIGEDCYSVEGSEEVGTFLRCGLRSEEDGVLDGRHIQGTSAPVADARSVECR